MKEKTMYRTVAIVTAVFDYVDKAHKEKGIQQKEITVVDAGNMDEVYEVAAEQISDTAVIIEASSVNVQRAKVTMTIADFVKYGTLEILKPGDEAAEK